MSSPIAFTHCSNNFLAQAKTMVESLAKKEPGFRIFLFLVDERARDIDYTIANAELIVVSEKIVPGFNEMVKRYTAIELLSCLKPMLLNYLIHTYPEATKLIYLDADIYVYHDFQKAINILEKHDIIFTPHFSTPVPDDGKEPFENVALNYGLYNLGFIAVNAVSSNTREFINWWSERTRLYGYQDTQHGFFVDQLWCNLAPLFFEKVYILKDYGYNMAPWNLHERRIKEINGEEYILSNGEPLVFYHFSSFDYFRPGLLSWKYDRYSFENCPGIGKICSDYCKRLKENGIETLAKLPCALDIRKPRSPSLARRLIRKAWNKT